MAQRSFRGLLWTLAIVGLTLDLGSKYATFRKLADKPEGKHIVVPGAFMLLVQFTHPPQPIDEATWREPLQRLNGPIMPRVNHGALFGMGNSGTTTSNGGFMIISVIAAVIIAGWSLRKNACTDGVLCAALGLILGGTLGNLFDRVIFYGVRDFLYFHWFEWPVFNVADCCLVCGAGLLLIQAVWPAKKEVKQEEQVAELAGVK